MKSKIINDHESLKKDIRSTILCVDDERMMLNVLFEQLSEWFGANYKIEKALSGREALEIVDRCIKNDEPISVVISDYVMPLMKGDELLIEIKKQDPKIRKIMLTGYTSVSGIITAINQAGLYRFIAKPWDQKDLMLTIMEAIRSYEQEKTMQDLAKGFEKLYRKCEENTQHMTNALLSTIHAVNPVMASHSLRIKQYALWLTKKLELDESVAKNLKYITVLHDIGKLGTNAPELDIAYTDTPDKAALLELLEAAKKILSHFNEPEAILKSVQYQFERYDGSGLHQIKGKDIPDEARILAIVHYYDFIKTAPGNEAITSAQIIELLQKKKNSWFDPQYTEEFIKLLTPVAY